MPNSAAAVVSIAPAPGERGSHSGSNEKAEGCHEETNEGRKEGSDQRGRGDPARHKTTRRGGGLHNAHFTDLLE